MSPYNPHDSRIGKPGKPFDPKLARSRPDRPNIPAHAVTFLVAFALGVAVGAIAVLEGWA